jgi:hypothetical protein
MLDSTWEEEMKIEITALTRDMLRVVSEALGGGPHRILIQGEFVELRGKKSYQMTWEEVRSIWHEETLEARLGTRASN